MNVISVSHWGFHLLPDTAAMANIQVNQDGSIEVFDHCEPAHLSSELTKTTAHVWKPAACSPLSGALPQRLQRLAG